MDILKVLLKQFYGAKYERVAKSLFACLILFLVISNTEIRLTIAPSILYLTATAFSAGIMWQALNSPGNADSMIGLFMLPFANRKMIFSVVAAFTGYTLITKTFLVLTIFFAVHEWSVAQIAVSLLCACNGCITVAVWYIIAKKKKLLPIVFLWCGVVLLSIFFVQKTALLALMVLACLFLSILRLLTADAYEFYRPVSAKLRIRHTKRTGSIFLYLLRYLITNKSYLLNTVGLCAIAGIMPHILGQFEELNVMPLGFAILCLNTPICILLSCDTNLEQAVRVLPGQASRFCIRYCLFVFSVNMAVSGVYLISWQIQHDCVGGIEIITALLIALQSAVLSVMLEWIHPIRNWKVESDLLHHPHKYIVPFIMLLIAVFISMWSVSIWVLLCIVLVEVLSLPFIARRI